MIEASIGSTGCRAPGMLLAGAFIVAVCSGCGGSNSDDEYRSSEGESPPANVTGTWKGTWGAGGESGALTVALQQDNEWQERLPFVRISGSWDAGAKTARFGNDASTAKVYDPEGPGFAFSAMLMYDTGCGGADMANGEFSGDDKIEGGFGGDCTTNGTFVLERQSTSR